MPVLLFITQAERRKNDEAQRLAEEERVRAERAEERAAALAATTALLNAGAGSSGSAAERSKRASHIFDTLKRRSVTELMSGQAFLDLLQDEDVDDDEKSMLRELVLQRVMEGVLFVRVLCLVREYLRGIH